MTRRSDPPKRKRPSAAERAARTVAKSDLPGLCRSLRAAAEHAGVSYSTAVRWSKRGHIRPFKVVTAGITIWDGDELKAFKEGSLS